LAVNGAWFTTGVAEVAESAVSTVQSFASGLAAAGRQTAQRVGIGQSFADVLSMGESARGESSRGEVAAERSARTSRVARDDDAMAAIERAPRRDDVTADDEPVARADDGADRAGSEPAERADAPAGEARGATNRADAGEKSRARNKRADGEASEAGAPAEAGRNQPPPPVPGSDAAIAEAAAAVSAGADPSIIADAADAEVPAIDAEAALAEAAAAGAGAAGEAAAAADPTLPIPTVEAPAAAEAIAALAEASDGVTGDGAPTDAPSAEALAGAENAAVTATESGIAILASAGAARPDGAGATAPADGADVAIDAEGARAVPDPRLGAAVRAATPAGNVAADAAPIADGDGAETPATSFEALLRQATGEASAKAQGQTGEAKAATGEAQATPATPNPQTPTTQPQAQRGFAAVFVEAMRNAGSETPAAAKAGDAIDPAGPALMLARPAGQLGDIRLTPAAGHVQQAATSAATVPTLAVEIAKGFANGKTSFDIRLDPPELGRVDVRMHIDGDGKVHTHLTVERAETLDLLQRDARGLEKALQQAGLDSDKGGLTFSLRGDGMSGRGDGAGREARNGAEGGGATVAEGGEAAEAEIAAAAQSTYYASARLNVMV